MSAAISPERLAALNSGAAEARTLAENLATDLAALYQTLLPDAPPEHAAQLRMLSAAKAGVTQRMAAAGALTLAHYGPDAPERLAAFSADLARGWGAYALAAQPGLNLAERLERVRPLADDPHFGVREWAWLALRPAIAAEINAAITLLTPWTAASSPFIRRFAVEATRPRGVWSAHIALLKQDPALGLPLLTPLRADPEKYVQDSVANWLNDAAKSQAEWVRALTARWRAESPGPQTARIVTRALRSLA